MQNSLKRWTEPTNREFFDKNSGSINRYALSLWVIQAFIGFFSFPPILAYIISVGNISPEYHGFTGWCVGAIIMFFHIILHDEWLVTLLNVMDGDDKTVPSILNWSIPVLFSTVMVFADYQGASSRIRSTGHTHDEGSFVAGDSSVVRSAKSDYEEDLASAKSTYRNDSIAVCAKANAELRRVAAIKAKNSADLSWKKRLRLEAEGIRDKAVAPVAATYASALSAARSRYNEAKDSGLASQTKKRGDSIQEAYKADKSADMGGFAVTVICWVLFVFMAVKLTKLRVLAGVKPIARASEMDLLGNPFSNFVSATMDAIYRQMHRLNAWWHKLIGYGASSIPGLDYTVAVQVATYNGGVNSPTNSGQTPPASNSGGGTSNPTPPSTSGGGGTPTTPPASGGGSGSNNNGGGNGGGGKSPTTSPKTPQEKRELLAVTAHAWAKTLQADEKDVLACLTQMPYTEELQVQEKHLYFNLQPRFNTLSPAEKIEVCGKIADGTTMKTSTVMSSMTNVNPSMVFVNTDSFIKGFQRTFGNTVTQQTQPVTHRIADDALMNLKKKVLAESRSQFTRGDARPESVCKRLFGCFDEAISVLERSESVTPSVAEAFKASALDRIKLAQEYGYEYPQATRLLEALNLAV